MLYTYQVCSYITLYPTHCNKNGEAFNKQDTFGTVSASALCISAPLHGLSSGCGSAEVGAMLCFWRLCWEASGSLCYLLTEEGFSQNGPILNVAERPHWCQCFSFNGKMLAFEMWFVLLQGKLFWNVLPKQYKQLCSDCVLLFLLQESMK